MWPFTSWHRMSNRNITWHHGKISRANREGHNRHRSVVVWFTGLSGSGKSTLAHALEAMLHDNGLQTLVLDGDNIRHGLCADLGFSPEDRRENLRRVAEVAKLTLDAGLITLAAFISPMRKDRAMVKQIIGAENFIEVYVRCPVSTCEARDVKGLYKKVRAGEIHAFTGVTASYEAPDCSDLVIDTDAHSVEQCVEAIFRRLQSVIEVA